MLPEDTGVWASSDIPDLANNFDEKPGVPLSGSDGPIPGDFQFSYMDTLLPDYSGVKKQAPSETPDLASDVNSKPVTPLSGLGGKFPLI